MTDPHTDGNILAGPLSTVFTAEITTAIATCAGCARPSRLATTPVYGTPMGYIARCPTCDHILLRYTALPTRTTLDMRGITALHLTPTDHT